MGARDQVLSIQSSYVTPEGPEARAPRQVFIDEALDELRRSAWTLRKLGTPVAALGALAKAGKLPGGRMTGSPLATLYSGGGNDLFGSHEGALKILQSVLAELLRALMVVNVLLSYGAAVPRSRDVGFENLQASGADPSALGHALGR